MGKYKRSKTREKKEKPFASAAMVLELIEDNKELLESLDDTIVQIEKRPIGWGDEYHNENGYEYLLFFNDKSAYLVGRVNVVDDDDEWAQAEGYTLNHCQDYYTQDNVEALEVLEKLRAVIKSSCSKKPG